MDGERINRSNYSEDLFAERYSKFSVRDFQNNTRMNIKNADYAA
jgi:hypothetical protein